MELRGTLLARNTALNLVGQVIPLLVGLAAIPYIVRGLGTDGFGILSIAWVLLGYFSLFDMGLGRATTKFVAEALGRGEVGQIPTLVWTSLGFQFLFGVAGGVVVAALVPLLVNRVLKIPPSLIADTRIAFFILAASLPVVLATNALRGVLEAVQRFDLVNYVKVPANASVFLLPAIALHFGLRLPGIVFLLVLARFAATAAYLMCCFRVFPVLRYSLSIDSTLLRPLAAYGGWITVTNVVGPLLTYTDRFLIGALVSMAAVGYYTAPYEAVTRLWILPGSLATALFPAFSTMGASDADRSKLDQLYARSVKSLLLVMGPLMALVVVFAHQILGLWLGADFAEKSSSVLQILAVGVLINSMAFIPFSLLQGVGRPDVTAKFHLLELPIYLGLLWFLVGRLGIEGAALAWTLRVCVDALLMFGASCWLRLVSLRALIGHGLLRSIAGVSAFAVVLSLTFLGGAAFLTQTVVAALLVPLFVVAAWSLVLDSADRSFLVSAASRFSAAFGRSK